MANQAGNAKLKDNCKPVKVNNKSVQSTPEQRAEIVRAINQLWADGATINSACEAHSITHKTHWVWRNQDPELKEHYKAASKERHKVREDRLKELIMSAFERSLLSEVRVRTIKEGSEDADGNFIVKKMVRFEEFKDPTWNAIKMGLETYYRKKFKQDDSQSDIVVTFTDAIADEPETQADETE